MNVLSCFDGMGCARIALDRLGIPVNNYFASEIDKYAIKIAKKNYPDTVHLGDIKDIWANYNRMGDNQGELIVPHLGHHNIDLIVGGSPCQGFSYASTNRLNFDDPRSKLFFEFVRLYQELKPKYFLLENVKMHKDSQKIISEYLGVDPIVINSNLVSAQNRHRLYWTNIPFAGQPQDKEIILKDVLLSDATEPMLSNIYGGFGEKKPRIHYGKSVTMRTGAGGGHIPSVAKKAHVLKANYYKSSIANFKATNGFKATGVWTKDNIRKLDPIECERLQTVPDNYTEGVSNTQRYKMLGNGFTVDVIAHLLKPLQVEFSTLNVA